MMVLGRLWRWLTYYVVWFLAFAAYLMPWVYVHGKAYVEGSWREVGGETYNGWGLTAYLAPKATTLLGLALSNV